MTRDLWLDVGGVTIAITLPSGDLWEALQARYRHFQSTHPPRWHLTLEYGVPSPAGRTWIEHSGPLTRFQVMGHDGWIDLERHLAWVTTPSDAEAHAALERTMAYICMQALPRAHDGLLLHGVGVVLDGMGHVFFGASGRGKSTVARLAIGRGEVLSDENVIVRLLPAGPTLFSTPFWGLGTPGDHVQQRRPRQVPLVALYSLHHAPTFSQQPLSPAVAVMELLTSEKVATERPASAAVWLATAERLLATVAAYRLGFRPTVELWPFLAQGAKESVGEPVV